MSFVRSLQRVGCGLLASLTVVTAARAQSAECSSATPPQPAKPYILILADSSTSMNEAMPTAPDCYGASTYPATRSGHLRCGLFRSAEVLGSWTRVGLMAFPGLLMYDTAGNNPTFCPSDITNVSGCAFPQRSCGTGMGTTRSAASIVVPIAADNYWAAEADRIPSNFSTLLNLVDNRCGDCQEMATPGSNTPINGALRDAYRYLSGTFEVPAPYNQSFTTPLVGRELERPCRPVHVVVITDGEENCDTNTDPNGNGPVNAAKRLRDGFVVGGVTWKVKTHVIQLGSSSAPSSFNTQIANAGGTTAVVARTSREVADTITRIATDSIGTEVCDNVDNDCNGCVDEGFAHFCNRHKVARTIAQIDADPANRTVDVCCSGVRGAQNGMPSDTTCLGRFYRDAAGAAERPVWWLPCAVPNGPGGSLAPEQWLCESPRERCDEVDNDCNQGAETVDEGLLKCPNENGVLACPVAERCDGRDNDCNGLVDDVVGDGVACVTAAGCAGVGQCTATGFGCVPSSGAEVCDGIDNDCDGLVDETEDEDPITSMIDVGGPCGSSVGECRLGVSICAERGTPTAHVACEGGIAPLDHDACDGKDNDCDGVVDEDAYPEVGQSCAACGFEGVYQCRDAIVCVKGARTGEAEICNGIDDNCDGRIDENVPGVGEPCGTELSTCGRGVYVCGEDSPGGTIALRCVRPEGAPAPTPEICDGIDNDCNGTIDDGASCGSGSVCVQGRCVVEQAPAEEPAPPPVEPPLAEPALSGGGCSAGGSASSSWLMVLVLAGLAARRRVGVEVSR